MFYRRLKKYGMIPMKAEFPKHREKKAKSERVITLMARVKLSFFR